MTTVLLARNNLPLKVVAAIRTETLVPLCCFIISFRQPLQNGLLSLTLIMTYCVVGQNEDRVLSFCLLIFNVVTVK